MLEDKIQNPGEFLFRISSEAMLWIKEVEMVGFQCLSAQGHLCRWRWFGQQGQQISELQIDKFSTPSSFLHWKMSFKNQVTTCSDFPSEALLRIKEVEMVDSVDEF